MKDPITDYGYIEVDDANADEVMKLLDTRMHLVLFKNCMGSYTAVAKWPEQKLTDAINTERQMTDDFTPTKAIHRLTEKVVFKRIVGWKE